MLTDAALARLCFRFLRDFPFSERCAVTTDSKPRPAAANGKFWGMQARDWADIQEQQFAAGYRDVLTRTGVGAGARLLDAGCGSGLAASIAAGLGASISGIDAAEVLLAIARERVPAGDFRHGDLEELPFADDTFDVVTGFNSFQFAGNPQVALAETARVAKPGGVIAIMTWGRPEGMEAAQVISAIKPLMPLPPPGAASPFALSDEATLRDFAAKAGLTPLEIIDGASPWHYPDEETALRGLGSTGVAAVAAARTGATAVDAVHAAAIAPFRQQDGSYRIGAAYRCLLAKP